MSSTMVFVPIKKLINESNKETRDVTKIGNRERGTGNREWESGNECTAVTSLRIQKTDKGKEKGTIWRNVRKCYETNMFLLEQGPIWYWDKQSKKWRLERKSNWYNIAC